MNEATDKAVPSCSHAQCIHCMICNPGVDLYIAQREDLGTILIAIDFHVTVVLRQSKKMVKMSNAVVLDRFVMWREALHWSQVVMVVEAPRVLLFLAT
jgi:hypothetical protein